MESETGEVRFCHNFVSLSIKLLCFYFLYIDNINFMYLFKRCISYEKKSF